MSIIGRYSDSGVILSFSPSRCIFTVACFRIEKPCRPLQRRTRPGFSPDSLLTSYEEAPITVFKYTKFTDYKTKN